MSETKMIRLGSLVLTGEPYEGLRESCVEVRIDDSRSFTVHIDQWREFEHLSALVEAARGWKTVWERAWKQSERRSPDPMYMFIPDEVQALLDAIANLDTLSKVST